MFISFGGAHFFDRPRAISTRCSNENRFFIASVVKKRSRPRGVSKIEPYAFPSSFSLFLACENVFISLGGVHISVFLAHVPNKNAIFMNLGLGRAPAQFFKDSFGFSVLEAKSRGIFSLGTVFVGFPA